MIGQFLIAFREGLEAALVTAIVLAYLTRTGRKHFNRYVWYGVYLATAASLVLGAAIWLVYGILSEAVQVLFEGSAALLAVVVLSSMIYWMAIKGSEIRTEVERRIENIATLGATLALVSFSFIVVFREGLETVLFLTPFLVADVIATLTGAFLGILASLALAFAMFLVGVRIDIRRFFYFTSVLLVFLAGGLAGYGVHELIEYAELSGIKLGWFAEIAYNLNIPSNSVFHHKGAVGSVFAVMFGYTVEAEWGRLIVHLAYLATALPLVLRAFRKKGTEVKIPHGIGKLRISQPVKGGNSKKEQLLTQKTREKMRKEGSASLAGSTGALAPLPSGRLPMSL